ncbi:MAG TPA: hypothetical protein VJN72_06895, partial [Gaiellales bacterium]|nr:hypothetical protein [Gaiellales bacterium]
MADDVPVKLAVQRTARGLETAVNAHDAEAAGGRLAPDFADRDNELRPLFARTDRTALIGTVANRTLFHLHLADGDTRVVELLWRDHG